MKLNREKVVVILDDRIYVYNFINLKIFDAIETVPNPDGICAITSEKGNTVLACPTKDVGKVKVSTYSKLAQILTNFVQAFLKPKQYPLMNLESVSLPLTKMDLSWPQRVRKELSSVYSIQALEISYMSSEEEARLLQSTPFHSMNRANTLPPLPTEEPVMYSV